MLTRNRNDFFAQTPQLDMKRSSFPRNFEHTTTFSAGSLIPLYVDEIYPGDSISLHLGYVCRQTTPIHPVFGNANFETFWFFIPTRLLWDDWEHFITGGLDAGEWDAPTVYTPPRVLPKTFTSSGSDAWRGFPFKSVADYMGVPVGPIKDANGNIVGWPHVKPSALPFRAYVKIWNDWFRASSIQKEIMIPTESGGETMAELGTWNDDNTSDLSDLDFSSAVYGGKLLKVNKYHDLFTSALPEPQRGEPVGVPLQGSIPVSVLSDYPSEDLFKLVPESSAVSAQVYQNADGDLTFDNSSVDSVLRWPTLHADVAKAGTSINLSINDLRHAIAVQHILEIDALSGSGRYIDLLLGHFGVSSPDGRLQRAEYLGGNSVPVNMEQVLQTSASNDVSPQGNTAAFSLTSGVSDHITKSFTEHGILMCVGCVRHVHSYQQGLDKMWSRESRYDYYWPSMSNISEQAILNREIFATGTPADEEAFGYQEAWYDLRYSRNIVTSSMRSSYPQSLDVWHYADYYSSQPYLSADWLMEGSSEIDRTLAVSSDVEDQFLLNIAIHGDWYRVIPLSSRPGLDRM